MKAQIKRTPPTYKQWVSHRIDTDVRRSLDRLKRLPDVQHMAVMPDVHLAGTACVGTVLATGHTVYPEVVGGDIGCGILAVKFNGQSQVLRDAPGAAWVLAALTNSVPINRHSTHNAPDTASLPEDLVTRKLSDNRLDRLKFRAGRVQLGTLGGGNHFVEFLADESGQLWLMIHSGSRSMGQAISAHHLKRAGTGRRMVGLDVNQSAGKAYVQDVQWARRYAQANRLAMLSAIARVLKSGLEMEPVMESCIHLDHNHLQREEHFGQLWYVHRKGAQRLEKGGVGVVPGSMATVSYLVTGTGNKEGLLSCSHGAGRKMSRGEARRRISANAFASQTADIWFDRRKSFLLRDEAPGAYKDIGTVMKAQRALVHVTQKLTPLINFKGG